MSDKSELYELLLQIKMEKTQNMTLNKVDPEKVSLFGL